MINEINTRSPKNVKNQDFIELKMICESERKSDSLQGFKLIGISVGLEKGKQIMTIDLIVNLWNEKLKKGSDFFTIGTSNVPNVDLKTESPYVSYRNKFTGNTQGLQSFLNKDESSLHAIGILYKKSSSFPELTINPKKNILVVEQ